VAFVSHDAPEGVRRVREIDRVEEVVERWRKPATIYDVVEGDTLVAMPSGEMMIDAHVTVDDETIERMKAGYICINCLEPLETPFPERCEAMKLPDGKVIGCYYPVRDNQLRDLHMKYGSLEEIDLRPKVDKAEEIERLREMDDFENRTGIILPESVKFPTQVIRSEGPARGV